MFARKLKALGYCNENGFNENNEVELRNLIAWLEDEHIHHYKVEERASLKDIKSSSWVASLKKYLAELKCPVENLCMKASVVNWLISHAVQCKFSENAKSYNEFHQEKSRTCGNNNAVLNNISIDNPELKVGIESLRKLLQIPQHDDLGLVLQAIAKLIQDRLSERAIKEAKQQKNAKAKDEYLSLDDTSLGFNTKDPAVNEVAKILRLLQIHNLRDLQTQINKAIVSTQKLTANPKTDQSLGRVGR